MSTSAAVREIRARVEHKCYEKAKAKGQLTFTVVEQDLTAPLTILEWIRLQIDKQGAGAPEHKLRDAFDDCLAMLYSTKTKKFAD